ncbi:uncharacterized protein LOC131671922 [Phymastichus coffea]|uniref:uncharacterized protein LOC131671922 n=1 Tax=Phymastichus coffea TaxID=108790 RepID=UPI00273AE98A|nr:uncharacterized protein LOC131671922 [Phymastichus coffea]
MLLLWFFVVLNTLLASGKKYTSIIKTTSGPVRGLLSTTIENVKYAAFKGIPYARPPVDDLRFKPPVEIDAWADVYDAITEGSMCTQFNSTTNLSVGSEDCLYINVFTPHTVFNSSISKPVMVWIHGGAFTTGNSNGSYYGPDFILREDIIMVSLNYRLGPLGFLNLQHENATGNCGLKDQNLALKWVKKNIALFGGNTNNITIFGESAGSVSVDLHVLSDMSVGLFSQSISMSGSPLCLYWGFQSRVEAEEQAFRLGSKLGTVTFSKDTLLKTLYNSTAAEIVVAAHNIGLIPFRPSLENIDIATNEEKFLTECTLKKYLNGNYTKGPHIMGFTSNETVSFTGSISDLLNFTRTALNTIKNDTSKIAFLSDLTDAITTGIENLSQDAVYKLIKETTDLFFVLGIDTKQSLISRNNDHPIYYYRFSFNSNNSLHRTEGIDLNGVGHMDDLPYILYMPTAKLSLNRPDIKVTRKRVVKLWTNFAKYGNPTPDDEDDEVLRITWPDSRSQGEHLEIGNDLTIGQRPIDDEVKSLQRLDLGNSPVLNDCVNNNIVADVTNSVVSIVGVFTEYKSITIPEEMKNKINMNRALCFSFFVFLNILFVRGQPYTSVINTTSGPVRGFISTTIENVKYAAFKGIRYAKPPVNELRFKPPVEADPWTDIYEAFTDGNICTQVNSNAVIGSEDCLFINIFTPHTEFHSSISKPVMVWIYGGAFQNGYANQAFYGPDFILGEDVIMVSFNYRVSALGFLNLEHENATGNCALKDQSLALKWIKKNIAHFGGNPHKITIFGQSAGAASIDYQILSDMSTGLFKQSISMSGSPLCFYWGFQTGAEAVEEAFLLGSKLGMNTNNKTILLKALHDATAAEIVIAATAVGFMSFRPSLERTDIAVEQEKFLTECTLKKYIRGNYTKGPHMMGFVANETISFLNSLGGILNITQEAFRLSGNAIKDMYFVSDVTKAVLKGIVKLAQKSIYELIKQTTDLFFILGIDTKQKLITRNNNNPIYYYRFSFDSNYSYHRALGMNLDGIGHADELPYLLYMPQADLPLNLSEIVTIRSRFVKLWTNFAKYGNPTPIGKEDKVLRVTWPDSRLRGQHLEIGADLIIGPRPTDDAVKSLQASGLGTSLVLNDCKDSDLFEVIDTAVRIFDMIHQNISSKNI